MKPATFVQVSTSDLLAARRHIERQSWRAPWSKSAHGAGFDAFAAAVVAVDTCDARAIVALIDAVAAERANRPAPAEIVWTGPEPTAAASRVTATIVEDMFRSARTEVLLASFSLDRANASSGSIFSPLHESMRNHGVVAHIFYDVAYAADIAKRPRAEIATTPGFLASFWPFQGTTPNLYFDPRGLDDTSFSNMHAKMVVVDRRYVLVGSANLTDRGTTRSIELGVKIDDGDLATRLVQHWFGAVQASRFKRA